MTPPLATLVTASLDRKLPDPVRAIAASLGAEAGAQAVLFYGSNLRTGALDGVLDFYVLLPGPPERGIWPTVGYREFDHGPRTLRAKIATMRMATFAQAAGDGSLDTTIWTRFVQPSAIAWAADDSARAHVAEAIAAAAVTAARYAAALGPERGEPADYWRALFRATYAAELRVEAKGREEQIIDVNRCHLTALLPAAWAAVGLAFDDEGGRIAPALDPVARATIVARWRRRQRLGKPINLIRLVRAAFTFDGAARYGAWKIERHTGVHVTITPWRERHPVLAAPAVLWRVWRARRKLS
ncbi:MAG: hypothetical protein V4537_04485 [Pseudomonadota bacterium]